MLDGEMGARTIWLALLAVLTLAAGPTDDPLADRQWHLEQVGAPQAWEHARGEGIIVAVVDTGVDATHPDLAGKTMSGIDLVEPGTPPDDPNGHGTLVAGIIGAVADNGIGVAGTAPAALIMPVRVLDAEGRGTSRVVAEGIRWATRSGAHVINLSLAEAPGQLQNVDLLITSDVEVAIREAAEAGVLVVAASGNEGVSGTPYNADVPVLVVGATGRDDRPWFRSNRDSTTLFAPGVEIVSTYRGHGYALADGTSFAAPVVAAGAALLRQRGLPADRARDVLAGTAVPIGAGLGRVDLATAMAVALAPTPAPVVTTAPTPVVEPPPPPPPPAEAPLEAPQPIEVVEPPDGATTNAGDAPDPPPAVESLEPVDGHSQPPTPGDEPIARDLAAGSERGRDEPAWPVPVAAGLLAANVLGLAGAARLRRDA
jgi:subtilisin family serine protease